MSKQGSQHPDTPEISKKKSTIKKSKDKPFEVWQKYTRVVSPFVYKSAMKFRKIKAFATQEEADAYVAKEKRSWWSTLYTYEIRVKKSPK